MDSANQQASAVAAAVTAADQKASFGDQMAKATLDASDQKSKFEGRMAEAKLAAGDMKSAFDKLTVDNACQQANAAVAAANAADQQAGFDIRMAKAEHDAGGMKASFAAVSLFSSNFFCIAARSFCFPSNRSLPRLLLNHLISVHLLYPSVYRYTPHIVLSGCL